MKKNNLILYIIVILIFFMLGYLYSSTKDTTINIEQPKVDSLSLINKDTTLYQISIDDTTDFSIDFGMRMYNEFERDFTLAQFDSICKADNISKNLDKWHKLQATDGETHYTITEYLYIKSLGNNECIYRLVKKPNNIYKITKRINIR